MIATLILFGSAISISSCSDDEQSESENMAVLINKGWQKPGTNIVMYIWSRVNGINDEIHFVVLDPTLDNGIEVGNPLNWRLEDDYLKMWNPLPSNQSGRGSYKVTVSENTLCLNYTLDDFYNFIEYQGKVSYLSSVNRTWIYGRWINVASNEIYEFNADMTGRLYDKYMKHKCNFLWGADDDRLAVLYQGHAITIDFEDSDLFKVANSNSNTIEMISSKTGENVIFTKY